MGDRPGKCSKIQKEVQSMEIDFIPMEWSDADYLPYVLELVESMDLTPEQRAKVIHEWGARYTVEVEVTEIGGVG